MIEVIKHLDAYSDRELVEIKGVADKLKEMAMYEEFGKDDPNFDIGRCKIEEVAIVNFEKLKKFLEEVE